MKKILILSGGSGGHVLPGLTIANHLALKGWKIYWVGKNNSIESSVVPKNNIPIYFIKMSGFQGKNFIHKIFSIVNMIISIFQMYKIISNLKPNIVLGMGGYISVPGGLIAWWKHVPLIIHEQNKVAGLANKILSKFAKKVLQGFPGSFPNAELVGNPIRKKILNIPGPEFRFANRSGPIRVLIIGGSQGTKVFNDTLPIVAQYLSKSFIFLHQTGKNDFKKVQMQYKKINKINNAVEFIEDIDKAYTWTDIIICRSGALTVSEISEVGIPSILVPFLHKDRQQYKNAIFLQKSGAAKIIDQVDFTVEKIILELSMLNRKFLLKMAKQAKKSSLYFSMEKIEKIINSFSNKNFS